MKTRLAAAFIFCGLFMALNFAFGQHWTNTSAPAGNWGALASSADGTKLIAANVLDSQASNFWSSTNSGQDWALNSPTNVGWLASSADGNTWVALARGMTYITTNSGATWLVASNNIPNIPKIVIAYSSDATTMMTAEQAGNTVFYISTNSGVTWVARNGNPYVSGTSVTCSADGTKIALLQSDEGRLIDTTTNMGATWSDYHVFTFLNYPASFAASADGTRLIVLTENSIFTSTNWGATWPSSNNIGFSPRLLSCSADGNKLVAVVGPAMYTSIYTSTDSGNTWISNDAPSLPWTSVASSADGSKFFACTSGGGIWTSQTTPSPQLNLTPQNPDLKLSWIVPSTNLVLQQSADLSSWTDVTDAPALNLSNLCDEVTLSPTNSSGFFRLVSQ